MQNARIRLRPSQPAVDHLRIRAESDGEDNSHTVIEEHRDARGRNVTTRHFHDPHAALLHVAQHLNVPKPLADHLNNYTAENYDDGNEGEGRY